MRIKRSKRPGMALLLTLVMIVLLSLEVAVIGLVAIRGLGEEGTLTTRNTAARRAAESAINRLSTQLSQYLNSTGTPDQALTWFAPGGSGAITNQALSLDNPDGSQTTSPVTISAYVKERRGSLYHLIGRSVDGSVDLVLHRWVQIQACPQSLTGLTLILSDRVMTNPVRLFFYDDPYPFVMTDNNSRVFFGEDATSGKLWSWHPDTGLSTIAAGQNKPGYNSMGVTSDGRVFFGEDGSNGSFWTWKTTTGLSTLITTIPYSVVDSANLYDQVRVNSDGLLAVSESYDWGSTSSRGKIWAWKESVGLSTVYTPNSSTQGWGVHGVGPGGYIYYGVDGKTYYWLGGTSVQLTNATYIDQLEMSPDGRIAWQANHDPGTIRTWKAGEGIPVLTTIDSTFGSSSNEIYSAGISPFDSRIFYAYFGYTGSDKCLIRNGDGTKTTITSGSNVGLLCGTSGGADSGAHGIHHAIFIGDSSSYQAFLPGFVWNSSTGTSTLYMGAGKYFDEYVVDSTGRIFGHPSGVGALVSWKDGVGLSTLLSGTGVADHALAIASDDRVFVGANNSNSSLWTWKETTGLSTIVSGAAYPGYMSLRVAPDGRVYFGEKGNGVKFWTWKEPGKNCNF